MFFKNMHIWKYLSKFIRKLIDILENLNKSFCLLHFVGLRPRVYHTLTNFMEEGRKAPLNTPMERYIIPNFSFPESSKICH